MKYIVALALLVSLIAPESAQENEASDLLQMLIPEGMIDELYRQWIEGIDFCYFCIQVIHCDL